MPVRLFLPIITLLLPLLSAQSARAQFGEPPGARLFRMLDGDDNGFLEGSEWDRMPAIREFASSRGIDIDSPLTFDEFITFQEENADEMRAAMFSSFRGPSSGGGFGRGGESPAGSDDGRGSRRDRGRSFGGFGGRGGGDDVPAESDRSERRFGRGGFSANGGGAPGFGGPGFGGPGFGGPDRGSDGRDQGSRSAPSRAKTETPRAPILIPLPSEYASRDTNGDGQIGLYEWPRESLGEFAQLDRNSDGFLTPRELTSTAPVNQAVAVIGSSAGRTPPVSSSNSTSARTITISPPAATAPAAANPAGEDKAIQTATWIFDQIDRDKNGNISAEEFGRSRTVRPLFQKAGADITDSMSKDDFVKKYIEISSSK